MQLSSRLLTLPLAKYSRATDVTRDVDQFTWSHIQHDLILAIDSFYRTESGHERSSQYLRLFHGTQVLEAIPVQEMIVKSEELAHNMLQMRVQAKKEQLPISALTRRPLFALRYNLADEKIRRIQLKFLSGEDYDKFYNHLCGLGLRMSPSGSRPSTAGPLTSTTATANIGPSCPPARLAEINNRPNTSLGALQSSYANSTVPKVSSPLARHSVTMSSHAQEAATTPVRSHPAPAYSNLSTLEPPEYFPRPDSSSSNYLDRPFSSSSKDYDTPLTTTESPLALPAVSSTSTILSTPRQSSEGLLPPRRELPFARATPPKSAGSDGMRPVSRASSGPMGPPPIPSPSRIPNHMPSFARISDTGLNSSFTQRKTHSSEHVQDQVLAIPKSASSNNFGANLPSLPQPTFVETIAETAAKTARTNSSPATYGNPALVKRSSAQPLQSSTGGAQNVQRSSTPVDPPAFTDSEASYQCRIISELAKNSNENTSDALSSYAAKSEDERRALLDNFIWENMHDDNFITLVEDMGMCWSRVGLGLG